MEQLHQTHTGIFRGKLAYMPPERLRGEAADVQMDVFALGIVLYELLTGRKPFNTEIEEAIGAAILTEPFVPVQELRSGLPEPLQRIVHRAIAKDAELQLAQETPVKRSPPPAPPTMARRNMPGCRRRPKPSTRNTPSSVSPSRRQAPSRAWRHCSRERGGRRSGARPARTC